ncbi:hypothetical protein [Archaeoglobus sp.]
MYRLKIVVEDVKGDTIEVEDPVIKGKLCIYALSALIPYITASYRETSSDDWINAVEYLQCLIGKMQI